MTPGGPDIKAIFTAALEVREGPDRDAYLAAACGGDAALRRRVEELLAAFANASDVLGPAGTPAIMAEDETTTAAGQPDGATGPLRRADPEPDEARTHLNDAGATIHHTRHQGPAGLGTTATPDDHGDARANGDALPAGRAVRYFGDYEICRELGRGGMGVVYQARQVSLNRPVALKMVRTGLLASDDELRRFRNEAEAVALLDHPAIVPVYEVGRHDGRHYFSMKLVPGGSLVPLLGRYRDDPRAAAVLVGEAAEAVAHAHARGILHRDLKPANILIDAEGHPHLTDFGLARKVEADVEFTQSGAILGTPAYMSPEQAHGRRGGITTATDVYGLGAVLYALLTGKAPFGGDSVVETIDAVRNDPPESPRALNRGLPRDLETICLKCLEKDPRRRYPTAQALADDLRAWLDSRPIAARRVGPAERTRLWCRRRPAVAALSATVLLALVGGTTSTIAVQYAANRALDRKNAELGRANARVQQRFDLAVDAIKTFHTGVSEDFLLKQEEFDGLRGKLLKSAADFYVKLGGLLKQEPDRGARRALAGAEFELAELTAKVGDESQALERHREVLALREALAAGPGADAGAKAEAARSLLAVGRAQRVMGRPVEAEASFRAAHERLAGLAGEYPGADAYRADVASVAADLGALLVEAGQHREARTWLERSRDERLALAAARPADAARQLELARSHLPLAESYFWTGRLVDSAESAASAVAILERLVAADPAAGQIRYELGRGQISLGEKSHILGRTDAALETIGKARLNASRIVEAHPAVASFQELLAEAHLYAGVVLQDAGRHEESQEPYRRALELQRGLVRDHPATYIYRVYLAIIHNGIAQSLTNGGRPDEGLEAARAGLAVARELTGSHPEIPESHAQLGMGLGAVGRAQARLGRRSEAACTLRQAIAAWKSIPERAQNPISLAGLACCHSLLSGVLSEDASAGANAESRAEADRAMAALRDALARGFLHLPTLRNDPDLASIRPRPDFQLLLLDLTFPAQPFAP